MSRRSSLSAALLLAAACTPTGAVSDIPEAGPPPAKDAQPAPADFGFNIDAGPDVGIVFPDAAAFPDAAPPVSDSDMDGLGDDEDPEPNVRNTLLFADSFETNQSGWTFTSNAMEIDTPSSLLRVGRVESLVRVGWIGPRQQWADVYIRGLIRVRGVGNSNTGGAGRVGVMGRVNRVAPHGYILCGVDVNTGQVFISDHDGGAVGGTTLARESLTVPMDTWMNISLEIQRSAVRCTVEGVRAVASSDFASRFSSGSVGFRSFDVAFDADWVEVYDR